MYDLNKKKLHLGVIALVALDPLFHRSNAPEDAPLTFLCRTERHSYDHTLRYSHLPLEKPL